MLRFFRKYQKYILAVGGSILMVIFLVPQAIQGIGNYSARRGRTLATFTSLDGSTQKVSAWDYEQAQQRLASLVEGSRAFLGAGPDGQPLTVLHVLGVGGVERPAHWILLVHEARAHGLVSQGSDDARMAAQIIANGVNQVRMQTQSPEMIDDETVLIALATQANAPVSRVIEALNEAMGVRRLVTQLYGGGYSKISTARVQDIANEMMQGIDARTVVIAARDNRGEETEGDSEDGDEQPAPEAPADDDEPFTEAELQAQLDAYADVSPGAGERGFGYRLPNRVQLEWIEIETPSVRDALEDSDRMLRLEVRKYWLRNTEKFPIPGSMDEVQFEDVEGRVRRVMLNELTQETMASIARFIEGELSRETRGLTRDGAYLALPEDWEDRRVSYFDLAEAVQEQFDVLPGYRNRGDEWYSAAETRNLEGVGRAFTTEFGQRMTLADLIPMLKEFGGSNTAFVQGGLTIGPLALSDGTTYFVRITGTDPSRPAATIDEVRDELVRDLKKLNDYQRLVASKDELLNRVIAEGLEAVADEYDSLVSPQSNIGYAPPETGLGGFFRTFLMPPIGQDEETIRAIVDHSREIITDMLASGRTFDSLSTRERTFIVESPDKLALVVVQLSGLRPLTKERVGVLTRFMQDYLFNDELGDLPRGAPSFEELSARYRYVESRSRDGDELDEEDEELGEAATAE